ncbi:ribonuclease H-like domain, reverse transcriptase, RNA-dependent DNA polymerase [Tanacetum coccineum]
MAFVSSNNSGSTNEAVKTAHSVFPASTQANIANSTNVDNLSDIVIYAFLASQSSSPQLVNEDLEQIHPDDLEEMDLKWQMAMLTIRAKRFLKKTRRKMNVNGAETIGFDKSKVECYNCHKRGHFDRDDQAEEGPTNYALMAYSSISSNSELMVVAYKKGLESVEERLVVYKKIKKGNFMPPKPDLSFTGLEEFISEHVVENNEAKPKAVRKNNGALIIEDWVSDSEEEDVPQAKTEKKSVKSSFAKIEFVKPKQQEKTARKIVNHVEQNRQNTHTTIGNQRNWNNMMVNHENFAKKTHPNALRNMVLKAILTRSGKVLINTARQIRPTAVSVNTDRHVNIAHTKTTVNGSSTMVNIVRGNNVNTARPKAVVNAAKRYIGTLHNGLTGKVVMTSDCSRHMNGSMSYLTNYEEIDGGYVTFGGNHKGGKITDKGIKREFSVARTPQQNGVAERKNRTLIKAARTMLFDGKADEGFFIGYFLNSKAFRVFNSRTRLVEESLHIRFSKNTPNVAGSIKDNDNASQASKETEPDRKYILLPLWTPDPPFSQDPKSSQDVGFKPLGDAEKKDDKDPGNTSGLKDQEDEKNEEPKKILWVTMDVKSDFLYGKIEEEVYVCQPPGFEDPNFPDKVYKVEKAFYGLHQAPRAWYETLSTYLLNNEFHKGKIEKTLFIKRMSSMGELTFFLGLQVKQKKDGIFISQDKYVVEILKKFGYSEAKIASTPMESYKPLLKDKDGEEVDIPSQPKSTHLHAVKRIFRYLKGQPKLGLWYPKDSPFDLVAYTDSDYAGASLDRKSTTGGCQFLVCRLVSWQCKETYTMVFKFPQPKA